MVKNLYTESELIEGIRKRDNDIFVNLYKQCFHLVLKFVKLNSGKNEDAEDVYNESIFCLIEIIDRPTLELKCRVTTFLFSICMKQWKRVLEKQKAAQNYQYRNNECLEVEDFSDKMDKDFFWNILWESFRHLKDDCKIIIKAYLKEMPAKDIAELMDFSETYLSKKKHYCHKFLFEFVYQHPEYKQLQKTGELTKIKELL
jgi:RNA polymerase sigma factor (sigma-70 family)